MAIDMAFRRNKYKNFWTASGIKLKWGYRIHITQQKLVKRSRQNLKGLWLVISWDGHILKETVPYALPFWNSRHTQQKKRTLFKTKTSYGQKLLKVVTENFNMNFTLLSDWDNVCFSRNHSTDAGSYYRGWKRTSNGSYYDDQEKASGFFKPESVPLVGKKVNPNWIFIPFPS